MEITFQGRTIDLDRLVRLYPAVQIRLEDGETAQVSIEWAEAKFDHIDIDGFILSWDLGDGKPNERLKEEFFYPTFDELETSLKEAYKLIESVRKS